MHFNSRSVPINSKISDSDRASGRTLPGTDGNCNIDAWSLLGHEHPRGHYTCSSTRGFSDVQFEILDLQNYSVDDNRVVIGRSYGRLSQPCTSGLCMGKGSKQETPVRAAAGTLSSQLTKEIAARVRQYGLVNTTQAFDIPPWTLAGRLQDLQQFWVKVTVF